MPLVVVVASLMYPPRAPLEIVRLRGEVPPAVMLLEIVMEPEPLVMPMPLEPVRVARL